MCENKFELLSVRFETSISFYKQFLVGEFASLWKECVN